MSKNESVSDPNPKNKIDSVEETGNLWDLPLPTFKVEGKSATQQLIEERESYR